MVHTPAPLEHGTGIQMTTINLQNSNFCSITQTIPKVPH